MFDSYFSAIFEYVRDRKKSALAVAVILVVASALGLGILDFDGSIEMMLPDKGDIHSTINFLRSSNLTDKIVVSLSLLDDRKGKSDLIGAVDQIAEALAPPLFTRVFSGVSGAQVMEEVISPDYFPMIVSEEDLEAIGKSIDEEFVARKVRELYMQMIKPQGIFSANMLHSDPLGIRLNLLNRLKNESVLTEYKVNIEDGYFISSDERHAMLIVHTPVPMTDSPGSARLISELQEEIRKLPSYISADIVGGHMHTVSNEKVIKRDIHLTIVIASVSFLLLFFIVFRDARAVLVFLVPVFSVLLAMNLSSLLMGSLSYWVAGLGTVIAGISVDYGIHTFVTVRNSGNTVQVIRQVARPVSIGALTTAGIFAAFFFSNIRGYHQLALFSILSIAISLAVALFILPHLLQRGEWKFIGGRGPGNVPGVHKLPSVITIAVWAVLVLSGLFLAASVRFDSDVVKLDGSEKAVFLAEERFQRVWGGSSNSAILVIPAESFEQALEKNDGIYREVVKVAGRKDFTSLSSFWPSRKTREENLDRWNSFWSDGRKAELRGMMRREGEKYGFSDDAFDSFIDGLSPHNSKGTIEDSQFLRVLKERFVQKLPDGYRILSFFPDNGEYISRISSIINDYPGAFIVSRRALSDSISETLSGEVKLFALLATIFIVLLTMLFLKDVERSLLALVPVLTNVLLLSGFMSLFDIPLNIANLIAGIVAMGLCIDYGIFMTYRYDPELRRSAVLAVTISAVTTLIGAGVLVFAEHPALFSIGITLVIGVAAGYLSSVLVVPSLENILRSRAKSDNV